MLMSATEDLDSLGEPRNRRARYTVDDDEPSAPGAADRRDGYAPPRHI
jgi:hypothetical protein